jgi:hypothetical protein
MLPKMTRSPLRSLGYRRFGSRDCIEGPCAPPTATRGLCYYRCRAARKSRLIDKPFAKDVLAGKVGGALARRIVRIAIYPKIRHPPAK